MNRVQSNQNYDLSNIKKEVRLIFSKLVVCNKYDDAHFQSG